ncbi:hypothetical protein CEV32_0924 [Brucella rhizosphaerae]|uniref:Uncharacterized protein n=1 Tax=Brucella rhizosphaerae TaxID=571254 RepID=A0A256FDC4_9HYPH|nr:hypothetical protein CEV32_0924 [Brucella rhizosphaerae]
MWTDSQASALDEEKPLVCIDIASGEGIHALCAPNSDD